MPEHIKPSAAPVRPKGPQAVPSSETGAGELVEAGVERKRSPRGKLKSVTAEPAPAVVVAEEARVEKPIITSIELHRPEVSTTPPASKQLVDVVPETTMPASGEEPDPSKPTGGKPKLTRIK